MSEVLAENAKLRLDSGYFAKPMLEAEALIRSHHAGYDELGSLFSRFVKGIFDINASSYSEVGVPFLRILNLRNGVIDDGNLALIPEEIHEQEIKTQLKRGDVVLSKTAYPAASLVTLDICNTSQDTIATTLSDYGRATYTPEAIVAYLNTTTGLSLLYRQFQGNVQLHLSLDDGRKVPVPRLSLKIQNAVTTAFKKAEALRTEAKQTYQKAESLLIETVGMADFSPSAESVNIKSFGDSFASTGRLDAEYYQPKYEDFEHAVVNHLFGFTTIKTEFDLVNDTSRFDKPSYNYIEIGDVNVNDGTASANRLDVEVLPANAKKLVNRGDLIVSKVRPNRGAVAIIDFDATDLIVSGAFTVLRVKKDSVFANETLKVLLRTKIYREWMLKFNIGTQYPVIRDEDILNLPIPCIDESTQRQIASLVRQSHTLNAESVRLLEAAKRAVEIAIEQDEAAGLAYLDSEEKTAVSPAPTSLQ